MIFEQSSSGIIVRRPGQRDAEAVGAFLAGLSLTTRLQRFFSPIRFISAALIHDMANTSPGRTVLLAMDGATVAGHVLAVVTGPSTVDVGIVVADIYQHRGVGRQLVRELTRVLQTSGHTTLSCDVLGDNQIVLDWLGRVCTGLTYQRCGTTITVTGSLSEPRPIDDAGTS